jgi:hypothetical protein
VLVGATCVLLFLCVIDANSTPIKPDVRKVLRQREQTEEVQFGPARAGWNGPEAAPAAQSNPNPMLESIGPVASKRAARAALLSALVPDPRAIAAIVLVILLLRRIRISSKRAVRAPVGSAANVAEDPSLGRAA